MMIHSVPGRHPHGPPDQPPRSIADKCSPSHATSTHANVGGVQSERAGHGRTTPRQVDSQWAWALRQDDTPVRPSIMVGMGTGVDTVEDWGPL